MSTFHVAVSFSAEDQRNFDAMARNAPKTFRESVGRAFSVLRRNIIKAMSGEATTYIPMLAPWHPLTNAITKRRQFGGVLADKSVIRVFKSNDVVSVGWITRLAETAKAWQELETHPFGREARKTMHIILSRCGIPDKNNAHAIIPQIYRRPQRDVMVTLADATSDKMSGWIQSAYEKSIKSQLAKGWVTA